MGNPPVKLLDRVRQSIRLKGYSIRTEKTYVSWIRQFILFHGKQHPGNMEKPEIEAFLSHLVMKRNVASSTQNQAFNAILFLYNHVLDVGMPQDINALRSKKPVLVPTVMTREETLKLIGSMHGTHQLMAKLMYGCGLRVIECVRLRVTVDKDVYRGHNLFALRVKGDSMINIGILSGDLVICEPRQYAQNGEVVAALINNEEATVKRFFLLKNHIELRPENEAYPVMHYEFGEVLIQGKVIGVQRGPDAMKSIW